jgi:transcriptional regulator with XRE-family HTH domain
MAKSQVHPRCSSLRRERESAGFTQAQLAYAVGVVESHVSHAETDRPPSLPLCLRFATVLGCPPSAIDPTLTDLRQGPATRIITDPNDLPDDLSGGDFIYESPNPYAKGKR